MHFYKFGALHIRKVNYLPPPPGPGKSRLAHRTSRTTKPEWNIGSKGDPRRLAGRSQSSLGGTENTGRGSHEGRIAEIVEAWH
jgi:hypothetical protein